MNSPLLRLPGEIRNCIYQFATGNHYIFTSGKGRKHTFISDSSDGALRWIPSLKLANLLNLTLVCRKTYHESRLHIFANNVFITRTFINFHCLLSRISFEQRKAITAINVSRHGPVELGAKLSDLDNGVSAFPERPLPSLYMAVLPAFTGLKRLVIPRSTITSTAPEQEALLENLVATHEFFKFSKKGKLVVELI